jgi:hypothetical protein
MQGMDVFFITYDEPQKEEFWLELKERIPQARRVDGIKGFDRAHKECANQSTSGRFFTIDGDNKLLDSFSQLSIPEKLLNTDHVLSWTAQNSVNGLAYGNGGVKNWRREVVQKMQSHEESNDEESAVDFCFSLSYFQMPEILSVSHINQTSFQAFRAGFREGVKMALDRGKKIPGQGSELAENFKDKIHSANLERLKIWASVGSDARHGLWAIYGARLGCYEFYLNNTPLEKIRDYDWFNEYWNNSVVIKKSEAANDEFFLLEQIPLLGDSLNRQLGLGLTLLNPSASQFFKSVYFNRPRQGLMFP